MTPNDIAQIMADVAGMREALSGVQSTAAKIETSVEKLDGKLDGFTNDCTRNRGLIYTRTHELETEINALKISGSGVSAKLAMTFGFIIAVVTAVAISGATAFFGK